MKKSIITIAWLCLVLSQPVHARSDDGQKNQRCSNAIIRAVGKRIGFDKFAYSNANSGRIIADVCKVWPKNNSITIAAFVWWSSVDTTQVIVAMLDNRNGEVIASESYSEVYPHVPQAGQVGLYNLSIDTARYDLAPGVRAFGLDVKSAQQPKSYCGDDEIEKVRTLYIQDGREIRPILTKLSMSYRHFVQGDPRCASEKSAAPAPKKVMEDIHLTIAIGKAVTDGYANLLITAVSSYDDRRKSKRMPFHYELTYHSITYQDHEVGSYPTDEMGIALDKWRRE
jgi:hypothetical protein